MTDSSVEAVARAVQLWWMTQKHEPMHQNDALDLARAAIAGLPSPEREPMREALEECRETFAFYVRHHEAKLRMSSDSGEQSNLQDKIYRNQEMVDLCDQALANPATIRDTDEDAVEADMRAYAEAAMQHGWKTAVDAAANGRLVGGWERDWFEQNPPKCARLASLEPAAPVEDGEAFDAQMVERAITDLSRLHERLLGCFTTPTGEPPLRRPRFFHPTMNDCLTVIAGVISIEHLRSAASRLASSTPIKDDHNALQRDGTGEGAPLDDLDEIDPVYQGLRTYAQNRRLLVLSIADLRRAARVAIQALVNPATIRDTDEDGSNECSICPGKRSDGRLVYCSPECVLASTPAEPDEPTAEGNYDERN